MQHSARPVRAAPYRCRAPAGTAGGVMQQAWGMQMDRDGSTGPMQRTTIAVDGGVFEHYAAYRGYLRDYLDRLLGPEVNRDIAPAHAWRGCALHAPASALEAGPGCHTRHGRAAAGHAARAARPAAARTRHQSVSLAAMRARRQGRAAPSSRARMELYGACMRALQVSALVELRQIRDASSMGSAYLAAAVAAAEAS